MVEPGLHLRLGCLKHRAFNKLDRGLGECSAVRCNLSGTRRKCDQEEEGCGRKEVSVQLAKGLSCLLMDSQ